MSAMGLLDRLLGHDSWTTRQLLDLAANLNDRQLDQEFEIGHRSIRRTIEHIIWNVECWTDLMKENNVRSRPTDDHTIANLTKRHDAATLDIMQFAQVIVEQERLDEQFLDPLDDPPQKKSFGGTIVHLATHGMHHRAHLLYMLRRLGVENLPEGDALSWEQSVHADHEPTKPKITHVIDSSPTKTEVAILGSQLEHFNSQQTGRDDFQPLNLVIRGEDDSIIGGLKSVTGWDWLYVQVLWVHERHRRNGLGSKLLARAETEARKRGCIGSCLSSYNFQSPSFYERHGYSKFGQIDDYPAGSTMFFLLKRFGDTQEHRGGNKRLAMDRKNVSSGTPWEEVVGYSRAVRVSRFVFVCGTTASDEQGNTVAPGNAYKQTQFILKKIESALQEVGAKMSDVVRTRMFVTDINQWEEIGKAHGEVFGEVRPAATMVEVNRLVNEDHLVEIEADAVISDAMLDNE